MDLLRRRRLIHWRPLENLLTVLSVNVAGARSLEEEVLRSERQAERRTEIERVLAQLPPRYRMYLILREREGLSYQEIAAITGDSLDTVKVTLYRARERARQIGSKLRSTSEDGEESRLVTVFDLCSPPTWTASLNLCSRPGSLTTWPPARNVRVPSKIFVPWGKRSTRYRMCRRRLGCEPSLEPNSAGRGAARSRDSVPASWRAGRRPSCS